MHSMFSLQDKQGIEESSFIVYYLEIRQIAVLLRSCIFFTYFLNLYCIYLSIPQIYS